MVELARPGAALAVLLAPLAFAVAPASPEDYPMRPAEVAPGVYAVVTPARDFPNPGNKGWNSNAAVAGSDRAPAMFEADIARWIDFLGELEALQPEVVVPGHGAVGGVEIVARLRLYFETLWASVRAGYGEGLADFEILPRVKEAMADLAPYYPGFEKYIGRSVFDTYLQVEQTAF